MSKRFSPAAIGAFVLASLALLLVTVLTIGSGRLFSKPYRFVCMFPGDLNGLKVGAPVKFRGVQIGTVSSIRFALSPSEARIRQDAGPRLAVFIDIDQEQIRKHGGSGEINDTGIEDLIKRGLRARLSVESLLTGVLYISLDLNPDSPLNLAIEPGTSTYPEIPTVPTNLEAMQATLTEILEHLGKVDFQALAGSITEAANSIREVAGSPALKASLETLKDTTRNLNAAVVSLRRAIDRADKHLDPLLASLRKNSDELNQTLQETRGAMVAAQATLDPDSPVLVHLDSALEEMTTTTRSLGELSDYLQRNPSAVVRGRHISDHRR